MPNIRISGLSARLASEIADDSSHMLAIDRATDSGVLGLTIGELKKLSYSVLNVKQYGAIGDGVADDTSAIQAACTAAVTLGTGGTYYRPAVYLPAGRYKTTDTIDVQDRIKVFGAGIDATMVSFEPTAGTKAAIQLKDTSPYHWFGELSDLTIRIPATVTHDVLTGVLVQEGTQVKVSRVFVNFDGHSAKDHVGIQLYSREQLLVDDCRLLAPLGIRLSGTLDNVLVRKVTFLSDSTGGSGLTATLPFAAIAADDNCVLQWFKATDLTVVKKHHVFTYSNNSAAAAGGIWFDNVRSEQGPDNTKYEFYVHGVSFGIDQLGISNSRLQSAQKGLDLDVVSHVRVSNTKFESASREVLKYRDVSGGSLEFDDQCAYLAGCTADVSGGYKGLTLTGLHGSKTWPVEWFSGTTTPAISANFRTYWTSNSVATTITAFNVVKSPHKGQQFTIVLDANTRVQHSSAGTSGTIQLDNGLDFSPPNGGVLTVVFNGTYFIEVSRSTL